MKRPQLMNIRHWCLSTSAALLIGLVIVPRAAWADDYRHAWHDAGREDFLAGQLGNSGQNLYVNHRGELETIRRFDLDQNGFLDLLFDSTHDYYYALPATLVTAARDRSLAIADLPVEGSNRVVACDLNRDGFTDLVFMPNAQNLNVQDQRTSLTIAWGGQDGWSAKRITRQLPVNGVTGVAVGDFNGDGWPDILTLNSEGWLFGQPPGSIVRVYWGGPEGFLGTRYQDIGIPHAVALATGKFGAQREYSAAVLTDAGAVCFLSADKAGRLGVARTVELPARPEAAGLKPKPQCLLVEPADGPSGDHLWVGTDSPVLFRVETTGQRDEVQAVPAFPASHLSLGRLDDDQYPDLVLVNGAASRGAGGGGHVENSVVVLWGAADGFNAACSTSMAIPNAVASAISDLNGDGHGDLLVAVHQGERTTEAFSLVFLGDGSRRLPAKGLPVPTVGAQDVAVAAITSRTSPTAVFTNSVRNTLQDAVPLRLYWGSKQGFSTGAMVDIPNRSGYKASAADLRADGHVDLIVTYGADISAEDSKGDSSVGAHILWGGTDGPIGGPGPNRFDLARAQVLRERGVASINVADINRDGWLDVVLGEFESADRDGTDLVIYYGSPEGFVARHRTALHVPGRSIGCLIADFNRDGWLDIVVGCEDTNQVITYWGGPGGYSEGNKSVLPYPSPVDLEAADLNGDGWLDLIVSSYEDPVAHHNDAGFSIFWGGTAGWTQANSQWLPGQTPLGLAVADLDGDGFLDIVAPSYHGEHTREQLNSYIYWGSAKGYSALDRTSLRVNSAADVVIADFNGDGKLDLAFSAHSIDAGHQCESPIFFNDGNRFRSPKVQYLPATGPHYMWVQDIGNIYNRHYEESFTSRTFAWADAASKGSIHVDATHPFGAHVRVCLRSAADAQYLATAPWREVSGQAFDVSPSDRSLQYRLDLVSANGDTYPIVRRVDVRLR